ncbi:MAG: FAD-dependent oxidoreductase, partial [Planctomycetota bacterium]|nr:FAD-dependent oxidoreductase [Planctomycetota bacterium]
MILHTASLALATLLALSGVAPAADAPAVVAESARGAVSAAVAAAQAGAKVFLAAPRPYLGEDVCGTLRLWLEEGERPSSLLGRKLFALDVGPSAVIGGGAVPFTYEANRPAAPADKNFARIVKPMHIKRTLDQALLEAKVDFLYGCYATDLLRDGDGAPCGIVMANRAGRQAVLAKVIIDATDRAWVARMAGATFRPYPAGPQEFKRVVIGGEPSAES